MIPIPASKPVCASVTMTLQICGNSKRVVRVALRKDRKQAMFLSARQWKLKSRPCLGQQCIARSKESEWRQFTQMTDPTEPRRTSHLARQPQSSMEPKHFEGLSRETPNVQLELPKRTGRDEHLRANWQTLATLAGGGLFLL